MKLAVFVAACSVVDSARGRRAAAGSATAASRRPTSAEKVGRSVRAVPARRIASRRAKTRTARSPRTSARWSSIRRRRTFRRSSPASTCGRARCRRRWRAAEAGAEDRAGQPRSEPRARHRLRRAVGERSRRRRARRGCRPGVDRQPRQGDSPSRAGARAADRRSRSQRARDAGARSTCTAQQYDKAIPLLTDLVNAGARLAGRPALLAEAYAGAGADRDAIAWLEERAADDPRLLPTLADFYERERRWTDAAGATRARCSARRATSS